MKFNEKLINLRKSKGMSQEELGENLNVTRQTISKWELGQTTPEMDKLMEIAKLFDMTLDELTNEEEIKTEEKMEYKHNEKTSDKRNKVSTILIVLLIILVVITVFFGINKMANKNKNDAIEGVGNLFDKVLNHSEEQTKDILNIFGEQVQSMQNNIDGQSEITENNFGEQVQNMQNIFNEQVENMQKDSEKEYITTTLEHLYNGTQNGFFVKSAIDKIVTNNKKEENKITVTYQGNSITDAKELQNLKSKFKDTENYEISFEYDSNDYIYQMDILDIK